MRIYRKLFYVDSLPTTASPAASSFMTSVVEHIMCKNDCGVDVTEMPKGVEVSTLDIQTPPEKVLEGVLSTFSAGVWMSKDGYSKA